MLMIFPVLDRIKLLPYFLRYYSSIGATQFVCGLHGGENSPFYKQILNFKSRYDLHVRTSVMCDIDGHYKTPEVLGQNNIRLGLNNIRKEYAAKFGWYCIADLDEFHFFRGKSILDVIKEAEERGYDAVHGVFFDRIAADGTFPEIEGPLDETFPLASDLTHISRVCCQKIVLAKSHVEIMEGHHSAKAKTWYNAAEVHHFKWTKGVDRVIDDKYMRHQKENNKWAIDALPRILNLVKSNIDITNPKLNVRKASRIGI